MEPVRIATASVRATPLRTETVVTDRPRRVLAGKAARTKEAIVARAGSVRVTNAAMLAGVLVRRADTETIAAPAGAAARTARPDVAAMTGAVTRASAEKAISSAVEAALSVLRISDRDRKGVV